MKFSSLALLLAGCVGSGVGSKQAAIVGGTNDSGDPAVVLVIIGDPNGGYIYMCTGEVISPHVVLTAGHCTTGSGPFNIYLGTDINRVRPSDLYKATAHPHPQYRMSVVDNYDVGVLVLDKAVPDTITPLPINADTDPGGMVGQSVRLVGYGSTGSLSPSDTSAGTKRVTTTSLSRVSSRLLEFDDTSHNTCEGDSGGPALMNLNGVETIVGVTSFGEQSPDYCDGHGFDTRVDLYAASFVQPFIAMYDPPPMPQPGQSGATGSGCNADSDCFSMYCMDGYCTASCDPAQPGSCPEGMHCQSYGPDYNLCAYDPKQRSGGCDVGQTPAPFALVLLLPLALLLVRASRSARPRGSASPRSARLADPPPLQ